MDDDLITMNDVRRAGHCVGGAKTWCTANRLDWRKLVRPGIPEAEFLASGDQLAVDVVRRKKERSDNV